jgi:hypothetical protein
MMVFLVFFLGSLSKRTTDLSIKSGANRDDTLAPGSLVTRRQGAKVSPLGTMRLE